MITRYREWDREGIPTETRRIEIDPRGLPGWRIIVFRVGIVLTGGAFLVGFFVWLFTTPWALACWIMCGCLLMGLMLEESE